MSVFRVTLKNYRCFEDSQPLTLEVGSGFTALVGPNNSGKSTFLKSFHELRQLFGSLMLRLCTHLFTEELPAQTTRGSKTRLKSFTTTILDPSPLN